MLHQLLIHNIHSTRAKSMQVWNTYDQNDYLHIPYTGAMHLLQMVRHIYTVQCWYTQLIITRGNVALITMPSNHMPYTNLEAEIENGTPYTTQLVACINAHTAEELHTVIINRTDKPFTMSIANLVLRAIYHEGYHTGQLIQRLKILQQPIPDIWN